MTVLLQLILGFGFGGNLVTVSQGKLGDIGF